MKVCCDKLERRITNPEKEDPGRIFFMEEGKLELYIDGTGEFVDCDFCPFCGTKISEMSAPHAPRPSTTTGNSG
jgi:hypothetical protein